MQETRVWSLGQEDPLEKEMAIHSSILAWEIPWISMTGAWQATVHGVTKESDTTEWLDNKTTTPVYPPILSVFLGKHKSILLLYSFVLLRTSYKWNPTVCNLSRLPFLTKLHASTLLCVDNSSPFIAEQYYLVQRYQSLFNHSPREGHLCFFPCFGHGSICCKHLWASSCVNISFHFSGINDQEWNCGLHGKCMFTLMRSCQIIFQSSWTILHSRQWHVKDPVSPHPHQHWVFSLLILWAVEIGILW